MGWARVISFDALQLLGRLADSNLSAAFQQTRGEAGELFTILPDGGSADRIRVAVEMLVNQNVQDDWGIRQELKFPRMRYELEVARRKDVLGLERLAVEHEYLAPIPASQRQVDEVQQTEDRWPLDSGDDRWPLFSFHFHAKERERTDYCFASGRQ